MKIAVTGHRPPALFRAYPYSEANRQKLIGFSRVVVAQAAKKYPGVEFIQGMALGFDQAIGEACVLEGVPFHAYVPFVGQENAWPMSSREIYQSLLKKAASTVVVCEGVYHPSMMQVRNVAMVDNCDLLVALWNGNDGGTANAVHYAQTKGAKIINVWEHWEKVR